MGPHELSARLVVPAFAPKVHWSDDTWAFVQWRDDPNNSWLEYLTFREVALERKKRLTIAYSLLNRYVQHKREKDLASMQFYVREAYYLESLMNIMMRLGYEEWTSTVDESVWPTWMCANMMIKSFQLCSRTSDSECIGQCDRWAQDIILKTNKGADEKSLYFWKAMASKEVAGSWIKLVKNEVD